MSAIEPDLQPGRPVTAQDVEQAVDLTRGLLKLAADMLPRPHSQKTGPKNQNRILNWARLEASELTNLKAELSDNVSRSSRIAAKIKRLFTGVEQLWNIEGDSHTQLERDIASHDFDNGLQSVSLELVRKYFGYLSVTDAERQSEIKLILDVCEKLCASQPTRDVASRTNGAGNAKQTPTDGQTHLWKWPRNNFRALLVGFASAALVTALGYYFAQFSSSQTNPQIEPATIDAGVAVISKPEARARLAVIWDNGSRFSAKGNDAMYFESMKAAYDLAKNVFGSNSIEFAQASNHMTGVYETMGYPDQAIASARDAFRLYKKILGPTSREALNDQVNLGSRLTRKHNAADQFEAKALLTDAVEQHERMGDVPSMRLLHAHALEAYAMFFEETGDLKTAVIQSRKSVEIVETADAKDSIERGWIIANHAHMLRQQGNCSAAVAMHQRAIAAFAEADVPITHKDHAYSLREVERSC